MLIQGITVLLLSQLPHKFGEIIGNKAIVIGKVIGAEFRDFPAGDVAVHPIKKCRIGAHFRRERVKQAGGFKQYINALIDVADENH